MAAIGCAETSEVHFDSGIGDSGVGDAGVDAALMADVGLGSADAGTCEAPEPGLFRDESLEVDGEARAFFLYVPEGVGCAAPLLIDFHGTASGTHPEESYGLAAMQAMARRHGVIVARPRSGSATRGGFEVFQWDVRPGEIERNKRFASVLAAHLIERFGADPDRVYASGFSSGANMSAQLLGDGRFHGFGMIGGGDWTGGPDPVVASESRVYFDTGYRDYLWPAARHTQRVLERIGHPESQRFVYRSDGAHELYDRTWETMWAFLDEGVVPPERDGEGTLQSSRLALEFVDGELALGAEGGVLSRNADGTWSAGLVSMRPPALVGGCRTAAGSVAIGESQVFWRSEGQSRWEQLGPAPEVLAGGMFGASWLSDVACTESGAIFGVGYWTGVVSRDQGQNWTGADVTGSHGYLAQGSALGASGETVLAAGYHDYIGVRREGSDDFEVVSHRDVRSHWYDVAAASDGVWYVAGDEGTVLRSTDDAASFTNVSPGEVPTGVAFFALAAQGEQVAAAGDGGVVWFSEDRGESWRSFDAGSGFVGDLWLNEGELLVAGERGVMSFVLGR